MEKLSFFTAVSFGAEPMSCSQSVLEMVDDYFYFGGRKACVIPGKIQNGSEGTQFIQPDPPEFLITVVKIVSYFTLVIPVIMLITKAILRSTYTFYIINLDLSIDLDTKSILSGFLESIKHKTQGVGAKLFVKILTTDEQIHIIKYSHVNNDFFPSILYGEDLNGKIVKFDSIKSIEITDKLDFITETEKRKLANLGINIDKNGFMHIPSNLKCTTTVSSSNTFTTILTENGEKLVLINTKLTHQYGSMLQCEYCIVSFF